MGAVSGNLVPLGCWCLQPIEAGRACVQSFGVIGKASSPRKTLNLKPQLPSIFTATDRLSRGGAEASSSGQSPSGEQSGFAPPVWGKISSLYPILYRKFCISILHQATSRRTVLASTSVNQRSHRCVTKADSKILLWL